MSTRSEELYVVIFDDDNAFAIPAKRSCYPKLPDDFRRDEISIGELLADGFRCSRGDENIGRDPEIPRPQPMRDIMQRLKARSGLALVSRPIKRADEGSIPYAQRYSRLWAAGQAMSSPDTERSKSANTPARTMAGRIYCPVGLATSQRLPSSALSASRCVLR